jgi:DNA-binding Lrp family transcriptional regulator
MLAYILCQLNKSKARDIQSDIGSHPLVNDVHILFGEWDLIVEVEAQNQQKVSEFVIDELRSNDDIALTSTLIVAE